LKGDTLALGNILRTDFDEIFLEGQVRGWRTMSHEIDDCSSCSYMSVCGSGCRAATYFAHGTPERSSPICGELRQGNTRRLLRSKGVDV
jgi:radical SAM protein with 4Fe4S-binding SPASM domain